MLGHRRRGGDIGLFLLFLEIARVGIDHIPPVTLAALALNVGIHLFNPFHLDVHDVCVGSVYVVHDLQLLRLLLANIYHLHDFHLYYNMTSLIWKGRRLEPLVGSWLFACMLFVFAIGSTSLMVASSYILMTYFDYPTPFFTCAAGFSGVLFALKVVVNNLDPSAHGYFLGFPVEIRYLAWIELAFVSLMFSNSSLLGHLCGIAMGYAYIYGWLHPIFGTLTYIKELLTEPTIAHNNTTQTFDYANSTGYNTTNNYATYNNNTNNITNNYNNNNATNNYDTNSNTTGEHEYQGLGEGFYNRYRNYNYNQQRGGGGGGGGGSAGAARSRTVVNGWTERS